MPSSKMEVKHLNSPDEVRKFENGKIELVKMGGGTIGRAKFEPGWRWSKHTGRASPTASSFENPLEVESLKGNETART